MIDNDPTSVTEPTRPRKSTVIILAGAAALLAASGVTAAAVGHHREQQREYKREYDQSLLAARIVWERNTPEMQADLCQNGDMDKGAQTLPAGPKRDAFIANWLTQCISAGFDVR